MSEIYRKSGTTHRYERRGDSLTVVRTSEHGEASITEGTFRAQTLSHTHSLPSRSAENAFGHQLEPLHERIEDTIDESLGIERATLVEGLAFHWWTDGEQERDWIEPSARAHVSLCHPLRRIRCVSNLGASSAGGIDLAPLALVSDALRSFRDEPPPAHPVTVLLGPAVTAELLIALFDALERTGRSSATGTSMLRQGAHSEFPFDGTGAPVRSANLFDAGGAARLPNVFRPSYRTRPVRAPFHVELSGAKRAAADAAYVAVGLLSSFVVERKKVEGMLLWKRSDRDVSFPAVLSLDVDAWFQGLAADDVTQWFPAGAGSYGRRLILTDVKLGQVQGTSW